RRRTGAPAIVDRNGKGQPLELARCLLSAALARLERSFTERHAQGGLVAFDDLALERNAQARYLLRRRWVTAHCDLDLDVGGELDALAKTGLERSAHGLPGHAAGGEQLDAERSGRNQGIGPRGEDRFTASG